MTIPTEFLEDLQKVFIKHKLAILGTLRLHKLDVEHEFNIATLKLEYQKDNYCYGSIWDRGDFLNIECDKLETKPEVFEGGVKLSLMDKETSFKNPVKSMADGKHYTNRKDWDNHLKANNCIEVGNDPAATRPANTELRGDFNIHSDMRAAVQEVKQRRGLY